MASKASVKRQKSSEKVVACGRTHGAAIAAAMGARYGPDVGEGARVLVDALVSDLDAKSAEMVARDNAHEAELRDDPAVRSARDAASGRLRELLVDTREKLSVVGGDAYVAELGFSGRTPKDATEVARLGGTVAVNLTEMASPVSRIPGYTFDAETWRAPIDEAIESLQGLTAKVALEEREAEATLTAKRAAIATYDDAFAAAANLLSNLLTLSGEAELAKRVRPSTRRSGQTAEDAGDTNDDQPTEDE